jgi:DUF4097 and DUF4098 domain-containing protein YvlB
MTRRELFLVALVIVVGLTGTFIHRSIREGSSSINFCFDAFFLGPSHKFMEKGTLEIEDVKPVVVRNAMGHVKVEPGEKGVIRAKLEKVIYSRSKEKAADVAGKVKLVLEDSGESYRVTTSRGEFRKRKPSFKTNLVIEVPAHLPVKIENRHGDVTLSERDAPVEIRSRFADIDLSAINGGVLVVNEHGDLRITDATGRADLKNTHGDSILRRIEGDVVFAGKHGKVHLDTVKGSASVETTYDDAVLVDIDKDVRVKAPHGEVKVQRAGGLVHVTNSFDDVRISEVGGGVVVRAAHSKVLLDRIEGDAEISTSYDRIRLSEMKGRCRILSKHSSVAVWGPFRGGEIRTSHDDVKIEECSGPLEVIVSNGNVSVGALRSVEPVTVKTTYGDISIGIPAPGQYALRAESQYGAIRLPKGIFQKKKQGSHVYAEGGSGDRPLNLSAKHGDVTIKQVPFPQESLPAEALPESDTPNTAL